MKNACAQMLNQFLHGSASARLSKLATMRGGKLTSFFINAAAEALEECELFDCASHLTTAARNQKNWEWHYISQSINPSGEKLAKVIEQNPEGSLDFRDLGANCKLLPPTPFLPNDWNVRCVTFSPDNRLLCAGSGNGGRITLIDTLTGEQLANVHCHMDAVNDCVFSTDGLILVTGSCDRTIRLIDARTMEPMTVFAGYRSPVNAVALDVSGTYVAGGSSDGEVCVWNRFSGRQERSFRGHTDSVRAIGFSPDGRRLMAAAVDGTVHVWDTATGTPLKTHCWFSQNLRLVL